MLKAGGRKARLIGNIGSPMLGVFSEAIDPEEIFVVELSSYMLDDIEYSPNIAVLLNLFPEHMDYHGGVENYYAAKENIFRFQKAGDTALRFPFSEEIPLSEEEIPLLGKHNQENIRAALAVARLLDISDEAIKDAIMNFRPLPHRLECVGTFEGITFYDDAISTTPESTMMALEALPDVDTIFLGGADRGYDFRELEKSLRAHHVRNIVLFPKTGERMLTSRDGFTIFETESMEEAVAFAFQHTASGKVCLLSTASPSYSLWKDFEEKGDLFKQSVRSHAREGEDI
jgi:UDP-N-acetylmuramoylalanine--D-glutamate ligase